MIRSSKLALINLICLYLCKFVGHTVTATPEQIADFRQELDQLALNRPTEIRVDYDPEGWHGYHLYPQYGAQNLLAVSAMQSMVS